MTKRGFERFIPKLLSEGLNRHTGIGFEDAQYIEGLFASGQLESLQEYIERGKREARKDRNSSGESQWRGAENIFLPNPRIDSRNPLYDTLVYACSSVQPFKGYGLYTHTPSVDGLKTSPYAINPITTEPPFVQGNTHHNKRDLAKRLKPGQSVIVGQGETAKLMRSLPIAAEVPEGILRTLRMFEIASETHPNMVIDALKQFSFRHPHLHAINTLEPVITLFEMATVTGQIDTDQFSSLRPLLLWHARNQSQNDREKIREYPYVSCQPGGVLFEALERNESELIVQSTINFEQTTQRLVDLRDSVKAFRSPKSIVMSHIHHMDATPLRDAQQEISRLHVRQKLYLVQAIRGWKQYAEDFALASNISPTHIYELNKQLNIQGIEQTLLSFFDTLPGVPRKARSENMAYQRSSDLDNPLFQSPLISILSLLRHPVTSESMQQTIETYPREFFSVLKFAYMDILRSRFGISKQSLDTFFSSCTYTQKLESAIGEIYTQLNPHEDISLELYHEELLQQYKQEVESSGLLSDSIQSTVQTPKQRTVRSSTYGREYRVALLAGAIVLTGNFPEHYLHFTQKLDAFATEHGFNLPGFFTRNSGDATGESNSFFPLNEGRKPRLTRYATVLAQPNTPIDFLYYPIHPTSPLDQIHQENYVELVDDIHSIPLPEDRLILEISAQSSIAPPPGFTIERIYVQENIAFDALADGVVVFERSPRGKMVLVLRRVDNQLPFDQEEHFSGYHWGISEAYFQEVHESIAMDPILSELHLNFREELWNASSPDEQTRVIEEYTALLTEYVYGFRYYSTSTPNLNQQVDGLAWIAANPDGGYECEVAERMVREFMLSVGVWTVPYREVPVRLHGNQFFGDWGHMQPKIYMPNGSIRIVDLTPPVTDRTPQADLDLLAPQSPSFMQSLSVDLSDYLGIGIGFAGMVVIASLLKSRSASKIKATAQNLSEQITTRVQQIFEHGMLDHLDQSEKELATAIAFRLMHLPPDSNLQSNLEAILFSATQYQDSGTRGAEYILDLANADDVSGMFLSEAYGDILSYLFEQYVQTGYSHILPNVLVEEVRRNNGSFHPSEEFVSFVRLVKTIWESTSGYAELEERVRLGLGLTVPSMSSEKNRIHRVQIIHDMVARHMQHCSPKQYALLSCIADMASSML